MEKNKPLEVLPTNDLLFQHIFGKVGNEEITKDFLEKLLGIEIEGLTLDTNKRMQGERLEDKIARIDVKARLDDGTVVIIEMQVAPYKEMAERMLYYSSRVFAENLKRGEGYEKLNNVIAILISTENLDICQDIDHYHIVWNFRANKDPNVILSKGMEIHTVELKKFDKRKEESPEDNWIKFINCKGEGEMEKLKIDERIEQAIEEFNRLVDDPEHHDEYVARSDALRDEISFLKSAKKNGMAEGRAEGRAQGLAEGLAEGKAEGLKEGEKKKQIEIAKKMLTKKMDINDIIELTRPYQRRN